MHRAGRNILSHAAIYLVARGLPGIIAFLAIPLFTRLLDPADYGRYALVIATASLINALLFQWLRLSLVRYLPAYRQDAPRLKSTLLTTTGALILILGLAVGVIYIIPALRPWGGVAVACWMLLAVQAIFELCCEHARSMLRPWYYMGLQITRSVFAVGLGVAFMFMGWGWRAPLISLAIGMGLAAAFALRRDWTDVRLMADRTAFRRVFQYGVPLSITVALTVVISSSDRFLLAWYMNEDAAGLYSVAVDFTTQTLTLLMMVVNMAIFPAAVRAFEHVGREAAQEQMRSNAALLMAIGVPSVVGLAVLAPGVAHCFLGKDYRTTAAAIIPLVALGAFVAGLKAYHFDAAFQFAHRTIYQVWIVLFAAVVNVILNLIAIPHWGINGAAAASVIAYIVSIALTAWLGRRHFALPFPIGTCAIVLVAGAVMAAVLFPFRNSVSPYALAVQVAAGAAIYAGMLLGFNFLGLRDALFRKLHRANNDVPLPLPELAETR
jgi:O-antigen/teichoic acid export membrane protein